MDIQIINDPLEITLPENETEVVEVTHIGLIPERDIEEYEKVQKAADKFQPSFFDEQNNLDSQVEHKEESSSLIEKFLFVDDFKRYAQELTDFIEDEDVQLAYCLARHPLEMKSIKTPQGMLDFPSFEKFWHKELAIELMGNNSSRKECEWYKKAEKSLEGNAEWDTFVDTWNDSIPVWDAQRLVKINTLRLTANTLIRDILFSAPFFRDGEVPESQFYNLLLKDCRDLYMVKRFLNQFEIIEQQCLILFDLANRDTSLDIDAPGYIASRRMYYYRIFKKLYIEASKLYSGSYHFQVTIASNFLTKTVFNRTKIARFLNRVMRI